MATRAQSAEVPGTTGPEGEGPSDGYRRRDFLNVAAVSFAGVGTVAAIAPLLVQMAPSADVLALATTEVDISKIQPGQAIKTTWRKQPIFIRNLTPAEIKAANAVRRRELRDPQTLAERTKPGQAELADHARRLHPPRLRAAGRRRGREPRDRTAAISARATARPTTPPARIRKGPAPRNLRCRNISSHRRRPSRSAEGVSAKMSFPWAKPYEPKHPFMRWLDERLPLPRLVYGAIGGGYPVPRNLNYFWNFGVLAGLFLTIQIVTGIVLAM